MKILIVEDEAELAKSISSYLEGEKYVCEIAASFRKAYDKICIFYYDCILLNIMLPDGDGLRLLEELAKEKSRMASLLSQLKTRRKRDK